MRRIRLEKILSLWWCYPDTIPFYHTGRMPTLNWRRQFLRLWAGCETGLRYVTFVGDIDTLIHHRIVIKTPHVHFDCVFNAHALFRISFKLG